MLSADLDTTALSDAVRWVAELLTGRVATLVAILAVASVGIACLEGRIDSKRAIRVVLGCFIVFGAPTIAAGLIDLPPPAASVSVDPHTQPLIETRPPPPPQAPHDPYAGASVPVR